MKYKKEFKLTIAVGIPSLIGIIFGSVGIPYIISKDTSMIILKIICSFIGVAIVCIVKFITAIIRNKKSNIKN